MLEITLPKTNSYLLALTFGNIAMRYKLRSDLLSSVKELEIEQEYRDNTAKDTNDIRKESTFEEWILKPQKENIIIAVEDIDKKQEKLIRNFYDGRRKKRSFTKIQGIVKN